MARRRKLTEPRIDALINGLRLGMTRRAAAGSAGIHHATFYRMLEADATFRDAVEKAEHEAEGRFQALVARAADDPKTWTAAAWWLERRRPEDYGRRDKVEMTVDLTVLAKRVAGDLDPSEVMAEAERILAEGG